MHALLIAIGEPIRSLLEEALQACGHEVTLASDARAAREAYRCRTFPLVLFEGTELGGPGVEVIRDLSSYPQAAGSVFVAITTDGRPAHLRELLDAGAEEILSLPVEPGVLSVRLHIAERRAESRRQRQRLLGTWESEETFRLLVETMNEGLGVRNCDGRIIYSNRRLAEMLGYREGGLVGLSVLDLVAPEDRERFRRELARRDAGQGGSYELVMLTQDGGRVHTIQSANPLYDDDGSIRGSFAVITDITDWKQTEQRLRLTQFTVDRSADAVFWMGRDGRFIYVNDAACQSLGYSREELLGMSVHDVTPDFPPKAWEDYWGQIRDLGLYRVEARHVTRSGEVFPVEVTANHVQYEGVDYHVAVVRDMTERKRTEEQLWHNAFHDALTGLPNRNLVMDRLEQCMARTRRRKKGCFAVLFFDLDRFKVINDSLGHLLGDELLVAIAHRLRSTLRAPDSVARIGGDEFLVLVEEIADESDAVRVAERILGELAEPFLIRGREIVTPASIGIAVSKPSYERAEDLLRDADIAMYRAKAQGGSTCVVFDSRMHALAVSRLELETDLRRALDQMQFQVYYQPILDVQGRHLSFEALVRWVHPERGLISPEVFLSAAEETGLIVTLEWWVIDEALGQLRRWCQAEGSDFDLSLSLNLSSKLVPHPELLERVRGALERHKVAPESVTLEISERTIMGSAEGAAGVLTELDALGVRVAIDDFGAGFSSLSHLQRLPLRVVKIDRSFVTSLQAGSRSLEIVRSVVDLAHRLGMETIAEGVETQGQHSLVRELGCDFVQGFHFARPMPAETAERWMKKRAESPRQALGA